MKGLFQCPPWAGGFCPLPFRYAPVTVGSGRAAYMSLGASFRTELLAKLE